MQGAWVQDVGYHDLGITLLQHPFYDQVFITKLVCDHGHIGLFSSKLLAINKTLFPQSEILFWKMSLILWQKKGKMVLSVSMMN